MSYDYITQYTSGNRTTGRDGHRIDGIVIHWWDDPARKPTFDAVVNWLCRADGTSSAHYVAEAGRVACIVATKDTAWHAGDYGVNQRTIGIECNPRMSAGDLETVAELIADIRKVYGDLPLSCHSDYSYTACPGTYKGQLGYLSRRANEILKGAAPAAHQPQLPTPGVVAVDGWLGRQTVKAWQRVNSTPQDGIISSQPDTLKGLHEGSNPAAIEYVPVARSVGSQLIMRVQQTLAKRGLYASEIDGMLGPGTIKGLQLYYGTPQDGVISAPSQMVIELQRALNKQLGR